MNPSTAARALGIDFGTSNSTVGWWRPEVEPLIELEDGKITLPSVVFFNVEERRPVYGRQALGEYLEGYEGRLMRSLKSLLGSKLLKSETTVLGSALPFKDLLGLFIGQLKARGEAAAGQAFDAVVLGRPVFFVDDDPEADREAQDTLVQVANKLGFKEVSFQYEPIAAAFDYERCIQREELVLIVDIGGGTSDFSLVRLAPERRNLAERQDDILATGGVHIGGTDFDKQLSLEGVMPLFGYGSRMKSDAFMPTSYHLNLATWHTINAVYAQKSQLALKNMRYDIVDSTGIDRLFRLIEERAGHWLAMQVEDSKIRLTETERLHLSLERIEAGLGVERPVGCSRTPSTDCWSACATASRNCWPRPGSTRTGSTRCSSPAVRAAFRRCAGARRCCPTPVMSRATCSAASAAAWPSRRSATAEPPWPRPCPIGG